MILRTYGIENQLPVNKIDAHHVVEAMPSPTSVKPKRRAKLDLEPGPLFHMGRSVCYEVHDLIVLLTLSQLYVVDTPCSDPRPVPTGIKSVTI